MQKKRPVLKTHKEKKLKSTRKNNRNYLKFSPEKDRNSAICDRESRGRERPRTGQVRLKEESQKTSWIYILHTSVREREREGLWFH